MLHVALLGDSIFDNARYTAGGPAVIHQVRALLPAEGRASLLAVDGAIARAIVALVTYATATARAARILAC